MDTEKALFPQAEAMRQANIQHPGVCLTVCRYWIRDKIAGTWRFGQTILTYIAGEALQQTVAQQNQQGTFANIAVAGATRMRVGATRNRGFGSNRPIKLKHHGQVSDYVFHASGLYMFVVSDSGGAHAMAFDTRAAEIHFFDPNQAEWRFTTGSKVDFGNWWSGFYRAESLDANRDYFNGFKKPDFDLYRFTVE